MKQLPKYFAIKRDENNPLWDKYIKWLNEYSRNNGYNGRYWEGTVNSYYGIHSKFHGGRKTGFSTLKEFPMGTIELTLEQWNEAVNPKKFPLNTFVKNDGDNKIVFDYLVENGFSNPNHYDGQGILFNYGINSDGNIKHYQSKEIKSSNSTLISFKEFESTYLNKQEKPKEMKNRKITPNQAQRIINIACSTWKPTLAEKWGKDIVIYNNIDITEEFYQEMRKACTEPQNKLFDEIFGKDVEIYPDGTPCLVKTHNDRPWELRYANGKGKFYCNSKKSGENFSNWDYHMKLDINNLPVNN